MGKFKYNPGDIVGSNRVVLKKRLYKDKHRKWVCEFICPYDGNIFTTTIEAVSTGNTRSCGCLFQKHIKKMHQSNSVDLTNKKSGTWTFLRKTSRQSKNLTWYWLCECENGHTKEIMASNFGHTLTCDKCNQKSLGEIKVEHILMNLEISYKEQYYFKDCKNPKTGHYLFFDFYLPDYNCCIEYDGIQHFEKTNFSHDDFLDRQYRDQIKNKYCEKNKILLVRIPYTDYDILDEQYLKERLERN